MRSRYPGNVPEAEKSEDEIDITWHVVRLAARRF